MEKDQESHLPVQDGMVGAGVKFERIRRITGYLVGTLDRFNDAKRKASASSTGWAARNSGEHAAKAAKDARSGKGSGRAGEDGMEEKLSTKQVAQLLGYSERTLERWRRQGIGPRWCEFNGRIWYRRDWIEEWEESIWARSSRSQEGYSRVAHG